MSDHDVRISPSSYHGTKVIGVTLKKYKELEERIKELETQLYFCVRNNKIKKDVNGK
jgi:hypothetical protein